MIPIVDAHTGRILKIGDDVPGENANIIAVSEGIFTALITVKYRRPHEWAGRTQVVKSPIKWFPRLLYYGPTFPVSGLRAIILPT